MLTSNLVFGVFLAVLLLVPLVIKWELDRVLALPVVMIIGLLAGLLMTLLAAFLGMPRGINWLLAAFFIVTVAAALLLWRFFRDPERSCPSVDRTICAAADGRVVYVKKIEEGTIPVSEKNGRSFRLDEFAGTQAMAPSGYLIGTAMTYLDVHVNRAPIAGKTRLLKHITGRFLSLKHPEAVFQNERAVTVIEGPDITIGVVQIASRLVRNIISFVQPGDTVRQGQRFGKIRFGSQVDLVVPDRPALEILVAPGDKLKAGVSIVARY